MRVISKLKSSTGKTRWMQTCRPCAALLKKTETHQCNRHFWQWPSEYNVTQLNTRNVSNTKCENDLKQRVWKASNPIQARDTKILYNNQLGNVIRICINLCVLIIRIYFLIP